MTTTNDSPSDPTAVYGLPTPEPESPFRPRKPYRFSTLCATVENPSNGHKDQHGSSSVPIYQSATFKGVGGEYDYSRSGNPTRSFLEHHIAKISSAQHAFAVSSGMAALDVILRRLKPGDEVIAGDDLYGGTNRLLKYLTTHAGVVVHHVDTTLPTSVLPFLKAGKTAMVLLESPTNPLLKIADIATISKYAKERAPEVVIVVDNTMMSPYLQRPLEHGADIVYDSGTKYLSGHHDLMAGVIACNRDDLAQQIAFVVNAVGNALTPFDSFLLLRGIKTLAVRMDRQQKSAQSVAAMLDQLGFQVHYPGLPNHPDRLVHERIADGAGAVLSFTTGDKALSERIVGATRLWGISVSFGCVNSLISMPCVMSHASIDPATRAARGLPEDLIRLCVGIEDPVDLIDDLERALLEAGAVTLSADHRYVRTSLPQAIRKGLEKLVDRENESTGVVGRERGQWFVSAPGKVIMFGEHAVVHGVTALAASIDLRCYGLTTPRHDGKVSVRLTDINDFYYDWDIDSLPWDCVTHTDTGTEGDSLGTALVDAITKTSLEGAEGQGRNAALAFLYLYMVLASTHERPSFTFTARSTLPIGAGLGSSAAFSTCAATALLLLTQRITLPPDSHSQHSNHTHDRGAIPSNVATEVNRWAFVAEKILHGTPSGVDNSVSVFGGALAYTRAGFGKKSGMTPLTGFKSLKFLLTDSKVPRDTKRLVASVSDLKQNNPIMVNGILDAIQSISDEVQRLLVQPDLGRSQVLSALSSLIDENHEHLVRLGVSHPSLETIRAMTAVDPFSLSTKLTGAGGGGCTVTLIPDEFKDSVLENLINDLLAANFQPYLTSVGGRGLGILSSPPHVPSGQAQDLPPAPPPGQAPRLLDGFKSSRPEGLAEWAEGQGKWLFV